MTDEKILSVIAFYEDQCAMRWPKIKPAEKKLIAVQGLIPEHVAHIKSMFPRMREFVAEGRRDKAFRWLGFIQGWLWCNGAFSVEELGTHNKPEEA
jgi:hypothetical protein